jgi:predicted TIM-barrel fold metal-dependent hydrolase
MRERSFREPYSVGNTYPAWSEMVATRPIDTELPRLQAEALDRARLAVLHCYFGVESFTHPYYAAAIASALNDWLRVEWLDRDDRLLGSAAITPQHTEEAVAEIERVGLDSRFVQIMVPVRSAEPFGNRRYWPIWEAAEARNLVVALTYGGTAGHPQVPMGWLHSFFEEYVTATQLFQTQLISLVYSGVFDRYPGLKVVLVESGWTWLPPFLWRIDAEWKAFRREIPWVREPPSNYIRRHVKLVAQPVDAPDGSPHLAEVLEQLGSDELLVYGSAFPHSYAHGDVKSLLAELTPTQTERLMWSNARELYCLA